MISDKYLDDSSDFTLYTKKELEQYEYIEEIENVTKKYNILKNENQLINSTEKSFLYIINYALELQKVSKDLPKDLENLFLTNIFLKEQINIFLEKKLDNLTKDDNIYFIKDINILTFISTIGIKENVLNSYYNYDLEAIPKIFRYYEERLKKLYIEDKVLFSLSFNSYIILLKTLVQLCTINSIDLIRKKSINQIIELMTETINIVKYKILLNDSELSKINNLQGKYLYYFSHLDDIPIDIKNLDKSFEKYLLTLEKQEDGFTLSKNNNFGYENDIIEDSEFLIFKNYSSILLLKLLKKIKSIKRDFTYFDNPYFQKIIKVYYKRFSLDQNIKLPKNLEEFEKTLLSSLLYNYYSNLSYSKKLDYHYVIEDFILSNKDFDNKNLETIYRILFFVEDIETFKYNHISQILVDSTVIKNDYHEFFKIAIFDLYINKIKDFQINNDTEELLEKICNYLFQNIFDFHLLSICSKIFLNISYIYSKNINTKKKANDLYALFILLNEVDVLENFYKDTNLAIKNNLQIKDDLIKEKFLYDFFTLKDFDLYQEIEFIKDKIIKKSLNLEQIKSLLIEFLSTKIFYGLCKVYIFEDETINNFDYEFEKYIIKIHHKFVIKFLYSKYNEKVFKTILEHSEKFIKDEFSKILNIPKNDDIRFYLSDDEYDISY